MSMNLLKSKKVFNLKSLTEFTLKLKQENKKSLVVYMTAGLPGWVDAIHAAQENGADIIEVGLPFSDPIMDGPIIANASAIALREGAKTLNLLNEIRTANFKDPIAVMTYTNVLYSHGLENMVDPLQQAGVSGLILPDLTFEQTDLVSDVLAQTDIALIQLIASTTSNERKKLIVQKSEGFLYCVAIKGITGQNIDLTDTYTEFIAPIKNLSPIPTYCGVGIRTPKDAKSLSQLSDGVIVGSSVVEIMVENSNAANKVGEFVKELRDAIDQ